MTLLRYSSYGAGRLHSSLQRMPPAEFEAAYRERQQNKEPHQLMLTEPQPSP